MIIEFDKKYHKIMRDYQKWHISWQHTFSNYDTVFQKRIRPYVYGLVLLYIMDDIRDPVTFFISYEIKNDIKRHLYAY